MALQPNFRRYVIALQYHGSSFLGFTYQKSQENCVLSDGTDLRGLHSVEGRLRSALTSLLGGNDQKFDNLQVSSRTDRGVHAIKNTLHVDIHVDSNLSPQNLHKGLNFHLTRQGWISLNEEHSSDYPYEINDNNIRKNDNNIRKRLRNGKNYAFQSALWMRQAPMEEVRILNVKDAPATMPHLLSENEDEEVEWNARFSAIQRTYIYRILHSVQDYNWAVPFEWDRSWRINDSSSSRRPLDLDAMEHAAQILQGEHDFSSFRNKGCQRKSPIVTLEDIKIQTQPYTTPMEWGLPGGLLGMGGDNETRNHSERIASSPKCQLITILYKGNAFLYRQVRNLTGCLMEVGRGRLKPSDVQYILNARDRRKAPSMAPAHGLYLVDVKHIGLDI